VVGGLGTTSTLTLKPTTGVGTTGADIIFQVGNNGGTVILKLITGTPACAIVGATDPGYGVKLVVAPALAFNYPTLGTGSGAFAIVGDNSAYGLFIGIKSDGSAWLQSMYGITTASALPLVLQPSGGGVQVGSPTGGDLGAGTLNADNGIYIDNVLLLGAKDTSISSGLGTIKMKSANAADNAAWIPIRSSDGTVYFVPGWTTNNP
jgi:hypothetical protein